MSILEREQLFCARIRGYSAIQMDRRRTLVHHHQHSHNIVLLTDPSFWDKVRRLESRAESGILHIDKKLPFDPITLLYYLLMSEIVEIRRTITSKEPMYEGGPHSWSKCRLIRSEERDEITLREDTGAWTEGVSEKIDIGRLLELEQEGRRHEIIALLSEVSAKMNTGILARLVEFVSYTSPQQVGVLGDNIMSTFHYRNGVASAESHVDGELTEIPEYIFHSINGFKYIMWGFVPGNRRRGVEYIDCSTIAISLRYWEVFVEPWLHLPTLLLTRPNPKIMEEVIAYWSVTVGYVVDPPYLQNVIINQILTKDWNDDVWIDAHALLSDAV